MKHNIKEIIRYIVYLAAQNDSPLTCIRLIKFLYLIDLYHARMNNGETITGWRWGFVYFGPYCSEAYEAIQQTASEGIINALTLESRYENKDEYQLFKSYDRDAPAIAEKLHLYEITEIEKAIKLWGDDTGRLLDHVYFETEPMRDARPFEPLDFTLAQKPEFPSTPKMKKISPKSIKRGKGLLQKLKQKHLKAKEVAADREQKRINSGLYDDHFEDALKYLDGQNIEPGLKGVAKIET